MCSRAVFTALSALPVNRARVALGIVAARLDYCNSLLYGTSSDNLRKLHWPELYAKLQEHVVTLNQLHWLPSNASATNSPFWLQGEAERSPSYLSSLISDYVPSHSLRSSDKLLLSHPYTSLVMSDKAFSVCTPMIWNDLSFNCRAATTVNSFKRNLKRELFYTAYADHCQ